MGETCHLKMVYAILPKEGVCFLCEKINFKKRELAKAFDDYKRFTQDRQRIATAAVRNQEIQELQRTITGLKDDRATRVKFGGLRFAGRAIDYGGNDGGVGVCVSAGGRSTFDSAPFTVFSARSWQDSAADRQNLTHAGLSKSHDTTDLDRDLSSLTDVARPVAGHSRTYSSVPVRTSRLDSSLLRPSNLAAVPQSEAPLREKKFEIDPTESEMKRSASITLGRTKTNLDQQLSAKGERLRSSTPKIVREDRVPGDLAASMKALNRLSRSTSRPGMAYVEENEVEVGKDTDDDSSASYGVDTVKRPKHEYPPFILDNGRRIPSSAICQKIDIELDDLEAIIEDWESNRFDSDEVSGLSSPNCGPEPGTADYENHFFQSAEVYKPSLYTWPTSVPDNSVTTSYEANKHQSSSKGLPCVQKGEEPDEPEDDNGDGRGHSADPFKAEESQGAAKIMPCFVDNCPGKDRHVSELMQVYAHPLRCERMLNSRWTNETIEEKPTNTTLSSCAFAVTSRSQATRIVGGIASLARAASHIVFLLAAFHVLPWSLA